MLRLGAAIRGLRTSASSTHAGDRGGRLDSSCWHCINSSMGPRIQSLRDGKGLTQKAAAQHPSAAAFSFLSSASELLASISTDLASHYGSLALRLADEATVPRRLVLRHCQSCGIHLSSKTISRIHLVPLSKRSRKRTSEGLGGNQKNQVAIVRTCGLCKHGNVQPFISSTAAEKIVNKEMAELRPIEPLKPELKPQDGAVLISESACEQVPQVENVDLLGELGIPKLQSEAQVMESEDIQVEAKTGVQPDDQECAVQPGEMEPAEPMQIDEAGKDEVKDGQMEREEEQDQQPLQDVAVQDKSKIEEEVKGEAIVAAAPSTAHLLQQETSLAGDAESSRKANRNYQEELVPAHRMSVVPLGTPSSAPLAHPLRLGMSRKAANKFTEIMRGNGRSSIRAIRHTMKKLKGR